MPGGAALLAGGSARPVPAQRPVTARELHACQLEPGTLHPPKKAKSMLSVLPPVPSRILPGLHAARVADAA